MLVVVPEGFQAPVGFQERVCSSCAGGCSGRPVAGPVRFSGGVCSVAGGCSGRPVVGPVRFSGGVCSVAGGCSGWLVLFSVEGCPLLPVEGCSLF